MQKQLSVIIVNWNSVDYLKECVPSIYSGASQSNFEVLVVDNASYDGSEEYLRDNFPEVKFVQSDSNLGFAKANNLGYLHSSGRYLLFLNPDTRIIGPALERLLRALDENEGAAIAGAKLLNSDGSIQTSCVQKFPTVLNQVFDFDLLRNLFPNWNMWGTDVLFSRDGGPSQVEMISGACLMIRREVFEALGLFSTGYFMYGEDADLCYSAKEAGWDILCVKQAVVVHHGGGSARKSHSKFAAVMGRESISTFMKKHYAWPFPFLFRISISMAAVVRMLILKILTAFRPVNREGFAQSYRKWKDILRWGLGLEKWAAKLNRP